MTAGWPTISYDRWAATCDTLHAHTQVLGKLAARLAPPEPQLQHAALRLTARGWETAPLPAPDGSGSLVVALDLHATRRWWSTATAGPTRIPLTPNRPVADVTRTCSPPSPSGRGRCRSTRAAGGSVDGAPGSGLRARQLRPRAGRRLFRRRHPGGAGARRVPRAVPRAVDAGQRLVGTFDLAVSLFSGMPADAPSNDFIMRNAADAQAIEIGWWPGDTRHPGAAFFAFAHPAPPTFAHGRLSPAAAHWDKTLGEYILDWDDVRAAADPRGGGAGVRPLRVPPRLPICGWDTNLAATADSRPPPIR